MAEPHVVILGAGPAGLGAAYRLRLHGRARVTVLERNDVVGGNAGSFMAGGQRLDYGSHRLHPACDPAILADIKAFLGDELLDRPRHGRIRLCGKWIHFPLRPIDLFLHVDRRFAVGTLLDMIRTVLAPSHGDNETFASVLRANLGPTICRHFYFPYAEKIWGRAPEELSPEQAKRRVSAGSFAKLVRKVLMQVPGFGPKGSGRFYYPHRGYGRISEAYAAAARELGAEIQLGWSVTRVSRCSDPRDGWEVQAEHNGSSQTWVADYMWSTLPIGLLAQVVAPPAPPEVLDAARSMKTRSMVLIYLELPVDQFTEYDAHYFPDADIRITRLSEPKNYAAATEPSGRTTLCAELPCSARDPVWSLGHEELADLVAADLDRAGIPLPARPLTTHTKRLERAYPIYERGYENVFELLDKWIASLPGVLSYGRQGLFAHDNTHHALFMAYSAASCLVNGRFVDVRWREYRALFRNHVVED